MSEGVMALGETPTRRGSRSGLQIWGRFSRDATSSSTAELPDLCPTIT